jgi:hypothetical protein
MQYAHTADGVSIAFLRLEEGILWGGRTPSASAASTDFWRRRCCARADRGITVEFEALCVLAESVAERRQGRGDATTGRQDSA